MMKRTLDIVASCLGLVLCLPFFVVAALVIKLDSAGPVFFRQIRIGKEFRPFSIFKFRTMEQDAAKTGGVITVGMDPRITRPGKFLRKYKLDELPQLFNILKGDMSIVGPRPEVPFYVDMFKKDYVGVLEVRPGLTDLASLHFIDEASLLDKAENPEEEYIKKVLPEKIRLAKMYNERACVLFDLIIIAQTLLNLGGARNILFELLGLESHDPKGDSSPRRSLRQALLPYRRPLIIMMDLGLIILANGLAFLLRFDGQIPIQEKHLFMQMLPWLVGIRGIIFSIYRLNEGLWRYTSMWDLKNIVSGVIVSTLLFYPLVHWGFGLTAYPRSVFIIDSIVLIGFLVGIRLPFRIFRESITRKGKKRVLVLGAGDSGERIVREMKRNPSYHYEPIGFIDDESSLIGQRIHGVKVLGTRRDLSSILAIEKPHEVLVALHETSPTVLREIIRALEAFKIPIKTLPNLRDVFDGTISMSHIRNLSIEDLLPRPPVGLQPQTIQRLVTGKRVLVSGAGGSIGSELCRQILGHRPSELVLYERYENNLYTITNELTDRKHSSIVHSVIGDVTDKTHVHATLKQYRPDIIFHAAAHKHVPLMESNPGEAIKNNVIGTRTVAEAANLFGVERFVLISTDKAVNPSSVMGATKRLAELVVQTVARHSRTRFITVRFGNVLGSNGSVVPRFQQQIREGGPVTVTHPEIRRYFMLIPEAVHLVLQAAALGEQGATYVLDMGEQIKLLDLARNLIRLSGFIPEKEIPITFVGLRPGEKLFEELVGEGEKAELSSVSNIFRIRTETSLDSKALRQKLVELEREVVLENAQSVIEHLRKFVPGFQQPRVAEKPLSLLKARRLKEVTQVQ